MFADFCAEVLKEQLGTGDYAMVLLDHPEDLGALKSGLHPGSL